MKPSKNNPIGVFDSGIGGLTVVKQLVKYLPKESIVYFGDTARVPYGIKSAATIEKFSIENVLFLLRFNVKCVIAACNTSSSIAIGLLKESFRVPVIGVIEPGAREALSATRNGRIGIIGTRATIASGAYQKEIRRIAGLECRKQLPRIKMVSQSCPLFVPLAEEGWINHPVTKETARRYLGIFKKDKIDTLILGCTHYPLLKGVLSSVLGRQVRLVDSARQCAIEVERVLRAEDLLTGRKTKGKLKFFVSDEPEKFSALGGKFLGSAVKCTRRIE